MKMSNNYSVSHSAEVMALSILLLNLGIATERRSFAWLKKAELMLGHVSL